jgi:hypothetical protein
MMMEDMVGVSFHFTHCNKALCSWWIRIYIQHEFPAFGKRLIVFWVRFIAAIVIAFKVVA